MDKLYSHPKYYEIAFSYRDIPEEVGVMEKVIASYSKIPVGKVFEFGCGNSPHMEEWLKRNYSYSGLDISSDMLEYSAQKGAALGYSVDLLNANMVDFTLSEQVDFCYTMLGSLYVQNTAELFNHFESVSRSLKRGGLYFLDWCVDFAWLDDNRDAWEMERDGIKVKVSYSTELLNAVKQTFKETILLNVNDMGQTFNLREDITRRVIYPQEFLLIADKFGFEFIGWWNNWNLKTPLTGSEETITRPIMVIRNTV